jgi:hypothetical protein
LAKIVRGGAENRPSIRPVRIDGAVRRPERLPPLVPPLAAEPAADRVYPCPAQDECGSRDNRRNKRIGFGAAILRRRQSCGPGTPSGWNRSHAPRRLAARATAARTALPGSSYPGLVGRSRHRRSGRDRAADIVEFDRTETPRAVCWAVHSAVGWEVTLKWTTRRRSCAKTKNTYSTWKRIVGTVKKSTETRVFMWLLRKVRQVWFHRCQCPA